MDNALDWEYLGKHDLPPGAVLPWQIQTWRSRVPGGWLIMVLKESGRGDTLGLTFYPDEEHVWDGRSLPRHQWAPAVRE